MDSVSDRPSTDRRKKAAEYEIARIVVTLVEGGGGKEEIPSARCGSRKKGKGVDSNDSALIDERTTEFPIIKGGEKKKKRTRSLLYPYKGKRGGGESGGSRHIAPRKARKKVSHKGGGREGGEKNSYPTYVRKRGSERGGNPLQPIVSLASRGKGRKHTGRIPPQF